MSLTHRSRRHRVDFNMPPTAWIAAFAACLVLHLAAACFAADLAGAKPNIILIIPDDMGYGDVAAHGNPVIKTPYLDRLHRESVRFTDYHVSPTCAPTRSALLTGRHEFKSGVTHTILERERLSLKAVTFTQVLKSAGYSTGIFGKWHLGDEPDRWPDKRGFDEMFIHGAGGIGQSYPGSCGDAPGNRYFNPAILHNGAFVKTRGYCTDVFFAQAMKWIESRKGKGPFYCHISPNAPHGPLDCPEEYEQMYAGKVKPNEAKFFGMITNIDDNIGRLLIKLKELDLERDTLVIFMTDNGTATGAQVFNAGMRGHKGTPYQGGTRVPCYFRWPGMLSAGVDVNKLTAHIDMFATLTELAGAKAPEQVKLDGRSLVPLLKDAKADWPDRTFVTHVGRWPRGKAAQAKHANMSIRNSRFTLVNDKELYDLQADAGEKSNVIDAHPLVAAELRKAYDAWWDEVLPLLENEDLDGPKVNPYHELYWKQFPDERPKKQGK